MNQFTHILNRFLSDESGQDLIEYALVTGLIGLSVVTAASGVATSISNAFASIGTILTSAV